MHTAAYIAYILIIVELMYLMYMYIYNGYNLYNLVIDIRATELHNESEEAKRDDKVDMGTCEISESGSEILGKTGCVVHVTVYTHVSVTCHSKLACMIRKLTCLSKFTCHIVN